MDDWKDPDTAQNWSADPLSHNPTRVEQLDILISILEAEYRQHTTILDIGLGSGIVEEAIFKRIPNAYVVGVDSSRAMLELAYERLRGYEGQYEVVVHDLTQLETLELPDEEYSVVISVQTIHNVKNEHKREIFKLIYNVLQPGGLFLLLDRIAVDTPRLFSLYRNLWDRLGRIHSSRSHEGQTFEEYIQNIATRGDLPITPEQHLEWLRDAGFEVACLHLHGNRALFAARK
jgi:ubiquinone/menaquinone biosynthesis C-methylase UbiE